MREELRLGNRWLGVIIAVLAASVTLHAYGPRVIRVEGALLGKAIVMSDWEENSVFFLGVQSPFNEAVDLEGRPFVTLSIFHPSTELNAYLDSGKPAGALRPEQAEQHAKFYPAVGTSRSLLVFANTDAGPQGNAARRIGLVRWLRDEALDILAKHGIPIRMSVGLVAELPAQTTAPLGPKTAVDDDWWKGNLRLK